MIEPSSSTRPPAEPTSAAARAGVGIAVAVVVGTLMRLTNAPGGVAMTAVAAVFAGAMAALMFSAIWVADKQAAKGDPKDVMQRRQRMRSIAIAVALVVLAVLFYAATIVRLGGNALNRPM